ncbi:hypothetical protein JTB14_008265 [Gonioctena quinquepunctata]|nr:hypothetical protein JTB14_008265 [Gonioctena quinquepunctata]
MQSYDAKNKVLTFMALHPEVTQKAKYEFNGKIMVIPVYGEGDSIITLHSLTMAHTINFKEITNNKKTFLIIDTYKLKMDIASAHFDFKNLFNGDEKLSKPIHTVINDNSKEMFIDVKEGLQSSYAEVFRLVLSRFFEDVPADELFSK